MAKSNDPPLASSTGPSEPDESPKLDIHRVAEPWSVTSSSDFSSLLTREMVTARLSMSAQTVDRLIARKELKAVRIGWAVRIRSEDLVDFLKRLEASR